MRGRLGHLAKIKRAKGDEDEQYTEHKAPVTDPIDDERLLPGVTRALLVIPEPDQQVGAEPHSFPADEHHQEVAAQDEDQHEEAEQVEIAKIPRKRGAGLVVHVGRRVDVDQEPDPGHHKNHHPRQRVQRERPRRLEHAVPVDGLERDRRNPVSDRDLVEPLMLRQAEKLEEGVQRQQKRRAHRRACHQTSRLLAEGTDPDNAVERGPDTGKDGDEPD